MKTFLRIIFWIWQLPQNLLAELIIRLIYTRKNSYKLFCSNHGIWFYPVVVHSCFMDNFTLGDYMFINVTQWVERTADIRRSYGHILLSRILGPLWLILVAIPRVIYAFYDPVGYHLEGYYTESLARYFGRKKSANTHA